MNEFNARAHFENQAGVETLAYLKMAEKYKTFTDELVSHNNTEYEQAVTSGTLTPGGPEEGNMGNFWFSPDQMSKLLSDKKISIGFHNEGNEAQVFPMDLETMGSGTFTPGYLYPTREGLLVLSGDWDNGDRSVPGTGGTIIYFLLRPEGKPSVTTSDDIYQIMKLLSAEEENRPILDTYSSSGDYMTHWLSAMRLTDTAPRVLEDQEVSQLVGIIPSLEQDLGNSMQDLYESYDPRYFETAA